MDNFLALLTGGAIGGVVGAIFTGFSKFFWERWLPDHLTWRRDQLAKQRQLLATYRDPSVRAISELQDRLWVIVQKKANSYRYLKRHGKAQYYVDSTAFLIAQYFAWSELMRRQIAALDYSDLSVLLKKVSEGFAHGHNGFQIFAFEQREIGERLMKTLKSDSELATFHYADFRDMVSAPKAPESFQNLLQRAKYLLDHFEDEIPRTTEIQHALIDLLDFVDPQHQWIKADKRQRF